jgi:hypothetical protein
MKKGVILPLAKGGGRDFLKQRLPDYEIRAGLHSRRRQRSV